MSAAKHTPGPWSFQASPAHGYRIRTSDSTSSLRFGSGDVAVVFFAGNGRTAEQCKADARLIAAAPKLLAELQATERHLVEYIEAVGELASAGGRSAYRLAAIRAAIVSATGSAS